MEPYLILEWGCDMASGENRRREKEGKRNFNRKSKSKEKKKRILILTEGEKTEPLYLKKFCEYFGLNSIQFSSSDSGVCVEGKRVGSAPISIACFAKKETLRKEGTGKSKTPYWDIIYCVFDRDTHPTFEKAVDEIHTLQKNNPKRIIKAIVSDICFELWFLLHFSYSTRQFFCADDLISYLKSIKDEDGQKPFKDYEKGNGNYFKITQPYIKNALASAEQLREECKKANVGTYTDIDILIHELKIHIPPAIRAKGNIF